MKLELSGSCLPEDAEDAQPVDAPDIITGLGGEAAAVTQELHNFMVEVVHRATELKGFVSEMKEKVKGRLR